MPHWKMLSMNFKMFPLQLLLVTLMKSSKIIFKNFIEQVACNDVKYTVGDRNQGATNSSTPLNLPPLFAANENIVVTNIGEKIEVL